MPERRRWQGDQGGEGIADGLGLAAGAGELVEALAEPNWVAEDADAHLLPHLRAECERQGCFDVVDAHATSDGRLVVELNWPLRPRGGVRAGRRWSPRRPPTFASAATAPVPMLTAAGPASS
jgi:hypothetical protein